MTGTQEAGTEPHYVRNNELSRYEVILGGEVAGFLDYVETDSAVVLPHTEIDPRFGGRGLGSDLVRFALDDISSREVHTVKPHCPFVAKWIARHPDYAHLVQR